MAESLYSYASATLKLSFQASPIAYSLLTLCPLYKDLAATVEPHYQLHTMYIYQVMS